MFLPAANQRGALLDVAALRPVTKYSAMRREAIPNANQGSKIQLMFPEVKFSGQRLEQRFGALNALVADYSSGTVTLAAVSDTEALEQR